MNLRRPGLRDTQSRLLCLGGRRLSSGRARVSCGSPALCLLDTRPLSPVAPASSAAGQQALAGDSFEGAELPARSRLATVDAERSIALAETELKAQRNC